MCVTDGGQGRVCNLTQHSQLLLHRGGEAPVLIFLGAPGVIRSPGWVAVTTLTVSCYVCSAVLPFPTSVPVYKQSVCGLHRACSPRSPRQPAAVAGSPVLTCGHGMICPHCLVLRSLITCMSDNKNHHALSPRYTRGPEIKRPARTSSFIPPWSPWTFRDSTGQRNKGTCPALRVVIGTEDLSTQLLLLARVLLPAFAGSGSTPIPAGHRSTPLSPDTPAPDTSRKRNPTLCPSVPGSCQSPPIPQAPPCSRRQQRVPVHGGHRLHARTMPSAIWTAHTGSPF